MLQERLLADSKSTQKESEPEFAGGYTLTQFKALPSDVKEYTIAKEQARKLGDADFMTFQEWKDTDKNSKIQFLEDVLSHPDPEVRALAKEMYGPTRIDIGQKAEEVKEVSKAKAEVMGQNYFKSPEWTDDVSRYLNSEDIQNKLMLAPGSGEEYSRNQNYMKAEESLRFIEQKITSSGGVIRGARWDEKKPKTMVWTVEWPSGDEEEIRYDVGY